MEKHRFVGKTYEEAVNKAKIELQELEENLIINVIDEKKSLLSKKCEIEVIEKREIKNGGTLVIGAMASEPIYNTASKNLRILDNKVKEENTIFKINCGCKVILENKDEYVSEEELNKYIRMILSYIADINSLSITEYGKIEQTTLLLYKTAYEVIKLELLKSDSSIVLHQINLSADNIEFINNLVKEDLENIRGTDEKIDNHISNLTKDGLDVTLANELLIQLLLLKSHPELKTRIHNNMVKLSSKIYDEKEIRPGNKYEFQVNYIGNIVESPDALVDRMNVLYKKAESSYLLDEKSDERDYAYQLFIKGGLIQIIYLLITHPPKVNETTQSDKHEEKLKSIIRYISTHYYEDISIEEIADFCHYSPSHFMKFFKLHMGTGFIEYLNDYRLTIAGQKLKNSSDSVLTIAEECGFEHLSYFNRLFKRKYGTTPGKYRSGLH